MKEDRDEMYVAYAIRGLRDALALTAKELQEIRCIKYRPDFEGVCGDERVTLSKDDAYLVSLLATLALDSLDRYRFELVTLTNKYDSKYVDLMEGIRDGLDGRTDKKLEALNKKKEK